MPNCVSRWKEKIVDPDEKKTHVQYSDEKKNVYPDETKNAYTDKKKKMHIRLKRKKCRSGSDRIDENDIYCSEMEPYVQYMYTFCI